MPQLPSTQNELINRMQAPLLGWLSNLSPEVKSVIKAIGVVWCDESKLDEAIAQHFEPHFAWSLAFAQRGWFPPKGLDIIPLIPAGSLTSEEDIEPFMVSYIQEELSGLLGTLCTDFPERAGILSDAVEAHQAGKFNLTVPVLYAQADGIMRDAVGIPLFGGRPSLGQKLREVAASLSAIDRGILGLLMATDVPTSQDSKYEDPLSINRHHILHGRSLNYGTLENSCRAISYLAYNACVAEFFKESPALIKKLNLK